MHFNTKDAAIIEKAIEHVENKSSAEVVVVIDAKAGNYKDIDMLLTMIVILISIIINAFLPQTISVWLFVLDILFMASISYLFFSYSGISRYFVSAKRKRASVEQAAFAAFAKSNVHETKERIGILIYLAVFEKDFYILADRGIKTFLPQDTWEWWEKGFCEILTTQDTCKTFVEHMERLGERLERYLPLRTNDINELPNAPVVKL